MQDLGHPWGGSYNIKQNDQFFPLMKLLKLDVQVFGLFFFNCHSQSFCHASLFCCQAEVEGETKKSSSLAFLKMHPRAFCI